MLKSCRNSGGFHEKTLCRCRASACHRSRIPYPFHLYDERGIRANAQRLHEAFAWNKGFKEYFAVKANPNPVILSILKEEGCGVDCATSTELLLAEALGFRGEEIMFSSNMTPSRISF